MERATDVTLEFEIEPISEQDPGDLASVADVVTLLRELVVSTSSVGLLDWLDAPDPGRGAKMARDGTWRSRSYSDLAGDVLAAIGVLRSAGVGGGDVVSVVSAAVDDFLVVLLAVLEVGRAPSAAAPGLPLQDRAMYLERLTDRSAKSTWDLSERHPCRPRVDSRTSSGKVRRRALWDLASGPEAVIDSSHGG